MRVGFHPSTRPTRSGDRIKLKDTMRSQKQPSTSNQYSLRTSRLLLCKQLVNLTLYLNQQFAYSIGLLQIATSSNLCDSIIQLG